MRDAQSCGQCECCEAWREDRDRLTRERDEARDYQREIVRRELLLMAERDILRALLREVVTVVAKCHDCINLRPLIPGEHETLAARIDAALEGRDG